LLSEITLKGRVWIASDIHLGPDTPSTAQAFHRFLEQACAQADALILCGDIFDVWIGDDLALHATPEWLAGSLTRFRHAASVLPLWLGRGNRDFLIGEALADHVGAHLLPEPVILNSDAGRLLLTHGDEYCTADPAYQRFRRIVRSPLVQKAYLTLGLGLRRSIADRARARSMRANLDKSPDIMDVDDNAVRQAFKQAGVRLLVHGHTHRPATHHMDIEGQAHTRIVLPDWDYDHAAQPRGGWLQLDKAGPLLHHSEHALP
jgi:UDP-2,3-diacylglucosamine hydrolase